MTTISKESVRLTFNIDYSLYKFDDIPSSPHLLLDEKDLKDFVYDHLKEINMNVISVDVTRINIKRQSIGLVEEKKPNPWYNCKKCGTSENTHRYSVKGRDGSTLKCPDPYFCDECAKKCALKNTHLSYTRHE